MPNGVDAKKLSKFYKLEIGSAVRSSQEPRARSLWINWTAQRATERRPRVYDTDQQSWNDLL